MKRNRTILTLIGALLAVVALGAVVMMVRANANDMLHQAARLMYDAQDGHAIVSVEMETPEEKVSGTVEVWGRRDVGPEGEPAFRIEILESSKEEAQGMIAVGDGVQVWIWNPDKNTVYVGTREEMKTRMAELREEFDASDYEQPEFDRTDFDEKEMPETPEEAVDKLLEHFNAERNGSDNVAGTAANVLRLIPIPEQMPEEVRANGGLVNLWLRAEDNAPLAAEYADGAVGYAKATATLLELDASIADEVFTFAIPEGAEVVKLAELEPPASLSVEEAARVAEFDVLMPADLPAAARLEGINEVRGAIVQRYRLPDGERFTIAQGPAEAADAAGEDGVTVTVRGNDGLLFSDDEGERALLTWSEGGVTFWVGGDLTADQALAVANSLQ
jgi:outer membrane lipoprotein-sorting protein